RDRLMPVEDGRVRRVVLPANESSEHAEVPIRPFCGGRVIRAEMIHVGRVIPEKLERAGVAGFVPTPGARTSTESRPVTRTHYFRVDVQRAASCLDAT